MRKNNIKNAKFADKCILNITQVMKKELMKFGRSTYKTKGSNQGFVIITYKISTQGNSEKYWFAYGKKLKRY